MDACNRRFIKRFERMEADLASRGLVPEDVSAEELESLWVKAKKELAAEALKASEAKSKAAPDSLEAKPKAVSETEAEGGLGESREGRPLSEAHRNEPRAKSGDKG